MRVWKSEILAATGAAHGFLGRKGGVSEGLYRSLNCGPGSKDRPEAVRENRRRALAALTSGPAHLLTLYQIHSAKAVTVTEPWEESPEADALVTNRPGLALGILTADCAPVLLCDGEAQVIGAAHAGWNGALSGVIEAAVAAMAALGAEPARIRAAIGPCIGPDAYEVGPEFAERFHAADPANSRFFKPGAREGHRHFDLPGYVAARLKSAGVTRIDSLGLCTYKHTDDFFSYRRATHLGEPDYGRELSAILLAP